MHRIFRPFRGLIVGFLFLGLPLSSLAADKKRKAAAEETKAKATSKTNLKQQAKSARDARTEKDQNKQQLTRKKNEVAKDKRGQLVQQLNKKAEGKVRGKEQEKLARREAEKKKEQVKGKLAQREKDKKAVKKEAVAKKAAPEKDAKITKATAKAELTEAKSNTKTAKVEAKKPETKDKAEPSNAKLLAKADPKARLETKPASRAELRSDIKELPASKFTLRPITKVVPKVELKFTVARALTPTVSDAPPPRDLGPDVIDVIEHDSPEAKRLDDLLRSEVKTLHYSSIPNVSHKKLDVGKMDADRIKQIQEVLVKKGYYAGEITGQYDDTTVEAMRKFQGANRIDVTGYATAQSLRLLGLTDW